MRMILKKQCLNAGMRLGVGAPLDFDEIKRNLRKYVEKEYI